MKPLPPRPTEPPPIPYQRDSDAPTLRSIPVGPYAQRDEELDTRELREPVVDPAELERAHRWRMLLWCALLCLAMVLLGLLTLSGGAR
jgi:hypothetical protein